MTICVNLYVWILVLLALYAKLGVSILPEDQRGYQNTEGPTSRQNIQVQMKELRNLAIIRAQILRRLGITDPPLRPTSPHTTQPPPRSNGIRFRPPVTITRILSEAPDIPTDTHILQFELSDIPSENRTVIDMVTLLLRVKYKKKKRKQGSSVDVPSVKSLDKSNIESLTKKNKKKRRRKQFLEIELTVSNVTVDGQPGTVLTSVRARLKKTKLLQLTLHPSVLESSLNADNRKLKLHIVCGGCGRRASLILLHKQKKRKRTKRKGAARLLHRRRPVLFIQSHKNIPR